MTLSRDLYYGKEKAEVSDGGRKTLIVHRLGDINIRPEIITFLNLGFVVCCRQYHDGKTLRIFIALDLLENLDA
jgi:hypothetical protein